MLAMLRYRRIPSGCSLSVSLMEDQSGLEPDEHDWVDLAAPPPSLRALLCEIGRVYPLSCWPTPAP
jgi:hypothetical protein